jgi:hypothetical protein
VRAVELAGQLAFGPLPLPVSVVVSLPPGFWRLWLLLARSIQARWSVRSELPRFFKKFGRFLREPWVTEL